MLSRIDVSDRNVYQECQTIVGSEILTAKSFENAHVKIQIYSSPH